MKKIILIATSILLTTNTVNASRKSNYEQLLIASQGGNASEVQRLLAKDTDINLCSLDGYRTSPLHAALQTTENEEVIELLLKTERTNPSVKTKGGNEETPLHVAISRLDERLIELLLSYKANPNVQNKEGETSLHYLANNNNERPEIMQQLLKANAKPNVSDSEGNTPLSCCLMHRHLNYARMLLETGANPNEQNFYSKNTPLHQVVQNFLQDDELSRATAFINLLKNYGAQPNIPNQREKLPEDLTNNPQIKALLR